MDVKKYIKKLNIAKNRGELNSRHVKIIAFGATLCVFFIIGCLWFLRPSVSVTEKRELTKFPKITWTSFWDGDYTNAISTWYADTFPLREELIAVNRSLQDMYGIRKNQVISNGGTAEDIPRKEEEDDGGLTDAEKRLPDGTVRQKGETSGSIYVTGNAGYELFYFSKSGIAASSKALNTIADRVGDKVNLYMVTAPTAAGVMLDRNVIEDMGASDQKETLKYLFGKLDKRITCVPVIDRLRAHNAEYLYFRTDHHWTQRGAYYAYVSFCKEKGIRPESLKDFQSVKCEGFRGTFTQQSNKLNKHPDTIQCWIPRSTNDMKMTMRNGETLPWQIIHDAEGYDSTMLYNVFTGGDEPYSEVHNPDKDDGSACLVIKDSFGNCFVPWLVDHYEHVYWVDVRYTEHTISEMIKKKGVKDVIFCMSIFNSTTRNVVDDLLRVGK